jgi:hypothetical protein
MQRSTNSRSWGTKEGEGAKKKFDPSEEKKGKISPIRNDLKRETQIPSSYANDLESDRDVDMAV